MRYCLVYRNLFKPLSKLMIVDILNHRVASTKGTRYILETVLSPMYTQADIAVMFYVKICN